MDAGPFGPGTIMGETNMYDLNKRIKQWRAYFAQTQSLEKTDIDELENHLREEIDHLKELKLSEEEALLVAKHRLGDSASIAEEYAKIDYSHIFRRRLFWAAAGVLVYLLLTYSAAAVEKTCILIGSMGGVSGYGLGFIGLVSRALIVIAVFFLCYCIYKQTPNNCELMEATCRLTRYGNFLIAILIILVAIATTRIIFPVMAFRMLDVQDYAMISAGTSFVKLLWSIILPILLVVVLRKLRRSELCDIET